MSLISSEPLHTIFQIIVKKSNGNERNTLYKIVRAIINSHVLGPKPTIQTLFTGGNIWYDSMLEQGLCQEKELELLICFLRKHTTLQISTNYIKHSETESCSASADEVEVEGDADAPVVYHDLDHILATYKDEYIRGSHSFAFQCFLIVYFLYICCILFICIISIDEPHIY